MICREASIASFADASTRATDSITHAGNRDRGFNPALCACTASASAVIVASSACTEARGLLCADTARKTSERRRNLVMHPRI
jgi:hypothetical protein